MSGHHAGHFYEIFDNLLKAFIVMTVYMVPPYDKRWEGTGKKCFKIFLKDSPHDMQIMSRHHAEYKSILETRKIQYFTSIHAQKLTMLSAIWVLHEIKKRFGIWNCIILSLIVIFGKCPGITRAMKLHGKQHSSYYSPLFMLKLRQNWVLYQDFI